MAEYRCLIPLVNIVHCVLAIGSMGRSFMVSPPRLMLTLHEETAFIKFYMTTFSEDSVQVTCTVPHHKDKVSREFTIRNGVISEYVPKKSFLPDQEMGPKWTFRFVCDTNFGLTVVMRNSVGGMATFKALPVEAWGTMYYVLTGVKLPFVQITSDKENNNIVVSFTDYPGNAVFIYKEVVYKKLDVMSFALGRWESFSISNCSHTLDGQLVDGLLGGTTVKGDKPIGVVVGSCLTKFEPEVASGCIHTLDMEAEMLLPVDMYHKRFVFPNIPNRKANAKVYLISGVTDTRVNISVSYMTKSATLEKGDAVSQNLPGNYLIDSDKPLLIVYTQTSTCSAEEPHDAVPNICVIIPTRLFHYRYIWRTPCKDSTDFILLVAVMKYTKYLQYDGGPLPERHGFSIVWKDTYGADEYSVGNMHVSKGDHYLVSTELFTFGCYIYGLGQNSSYMHFAGFQECGSGGHPALMGDLIDNDCDGQVDEELMDGRDNDHDGRVDEDIKPLPISERKETITLKTFYTMFLFVPVALGLLIFILGRVLRKNPKRVTASQKSTSQITMSDLRESCVDFRARSSTHPSVVSLASDNRISTVIFSPGRYSAGALSPGPTTSSSVDPPVSGKVSVNPYLLKVSPIPYQSLRRFNFPWPRKKEASFKFTERQMSASVDARRTTVSGIPLLQKIKRATSTHSRKSTAVDSTRHSSAAVLSLHRKSTTSEKRKSTLVVPDA